MAFPKQICDSSPRWERFSQEGDDLPRQSRSPGSHSARNEVYKMQAVSILNDKLVLTDHPRLSLGRGEVRIQVCATAVNRADLAQRSGHYPPPPGVTETLGLECSGLVIEVAHDVTFPRVGDQVCALLAGGGYATEVVCPATHTMLLPKGIDLQQAAAIPEVFTTAWLNLRREGELENGERVIVHAAASGVGTAALQLCRVWGCPTLAVVGSVEKERYCRELGADSTVDRHTRDWAETAQQWGRADVILDPVGGENLKANVLLLNSRGRLVNIGVMGGAEGTLPVGRLLVKRLKIVGSVLRSRAKDEKTDILKGLQAEVWPLFESGEVRPIIDSVFPLAKAEEAHARVASDQTVGKVLLLA